MKQASSPFYVRGGGELKNLHDLHKSLKKMSDEQFNFHVNVNKNDFAKWVHHCMRDHSLSMCLGQLKSRQEMAKAVQKKIKDETTKDPLEVKKAAPPAGVKATKPPAKVKSTKQPAKVKSKKIKLPRPEKIRISKPSKWLKTVQDKTQDWEETRRAPLPMTMEQIENHIKNRILESEVVAKGLPDLEPDTPLPDKPPKPSPPRFSKDVMQHLVPYALGIMAGVVLGIILFRFLI